VPIVQQWEEREAAYRQITLSFAAEFMASDDTGAGMSLTSPHPHARSWVQVLVHGCDRPQFSLHSQRVDAIFFL
jgi:hypothetical protein